MADSLKLRQEEYSALGDFIRTSFERDLATISKRFPKINESFKNDFVAKLEEIKTLESGLVLTEEQKNATQALYAEADLLNKELNFLSSYCKDAGLNAAVVSDLKNELSKVNIEGAVLKIEGVKQFIVANEASLIEEGMAADFATVLGTHKNSLASRNAVQNSTLNSRKKLTEANKKQYAALYNYIAKIMRYGKLVFSTEITKDEYTTSRVLSRMRAAKRAEAKE